MVIIFCCVCLAAVAAGALGWVITRVDRVRTDVDLDIFDFDPQLETQIDESFEVGDSPYLEVRNFAGNVTVRQGQDNIIRVVATKKASSSSALARVTVSMNKQGEGVFVSTRKSGNYPSARVDLEITAPPGAEIDLDTGAGNISFRDMTGSIRANSGAGNIDATGGAGPVRLGVGAGNITYQGVPAGRCSFGSGAGDIRLRLPARPDMRVDLGTGLGIVAIDYDVDGTTSPREVRGVIGNGDQASIYAHTGLGNISVKP